MKFIAGVIRDGLRSANQNDFMVAEKAIKLDHGYLCVPLNFANLQIGTLVCVFEISNNYKKY